MTRRFAFVALASLAACTDSAAPAAPPSTLLVSDRAADRIVAFDGVTGAFEREVVAVDRPSSVRLGPDGALYVAGFGDSDVTRVDLATGALLGRFYRDTAILEEPVELLFQGSELVVLGNDTNNAIVIDASGTMVSDVGYPDMRGAHDMVFGPDGLLYVATEHDVATSSAMQVWDVASGALVRRFGSLAAIANATGLAVVDDEIYVTDYERGHLLRLAADQLELVADDLAHPVSVDLGPDGLLYVIDDRGISRYALDGTHVSLFIATGANLVGPRSLTFAPR